MPGRYVVVSTTDHPDYAWYIPVVEWAWAQFGWTVLCLPPIGVPGYREETVSQCIRLYAADTIAGDEDAILMTSDADMIPLSDYWKPATEAITSYGRDLTDNQYPICYVAMNARKWREVMRLTGDLRSDMARDLATTVAMSRDKQRWWTVDQDLLTERLVMQPVVQVDRGREAGSHLARGRVDRWNMKIPESLIDFHAPREPHKNRAAIGAVLLRAFGDAYRNSAIREYVERGLSPQEQLAGYAARDAWGFLQPSESNWDTQRPLLFLGLCLTGGRVVALGSGLSSTPLIRQFCQNREFEAYDSNREWAAKTGAVYISDWDTDRRWCEPCSLLFVDHVPGEHRHKAIAAAMDKAAVIVFHDRELGGAGDYRYERILPLFRYHLHMNRRGGGAGTSMVSNVINVADYAGLRMGAHTFDPPSAWASVQQVAWRMRTRFR